MSRARKLVLSILDSFERRPTHLNFIVDKALCASSLDHRDRRFVFESVYGVVRQKIYLDFIIDHFLDPGRSLKDTSLRLILRFGAYQVLFMDRVPDHAAVNEAVNAARNAPATRKAAGLVNAVLRKIIQERKRLSRLLPEKLPARLALEYAMPAWYVQRLLDKIGLGPTRDFLKFINTYPVTYLRRQLRGLSRIQFEQEARPICGQACGWQNLFYPLTKRIPPSDIGLLREGHCSIQSPASGWVVACMQIARGDQVLDLCSAPGGKTLFMAELSGSDGIICANDIHRGRMHDVEASIERTGTANIRMLVSDGRDLPVHGTFDKILVDAPCSGTGVLHRHPEARHHLSKEEITRLTTLQGQLLQSAANSLTRGGLLVYATCSIEACENQEIVSGFLENNPRFSLVRPPDTVPDTYVTLEGHLSILPWKHGLDGMFAACLKK